MKGLICNRPAPGLIRVKERSSEVCEFQRPRHFFVGFQLHVACTSWDLFSQLGNLPLHIRLWTSSVERYKSNNLEVQVRQMALACFSGGIWKKALLLHSKHLKRAVYPVYTVCTSWVNLDFLPFWTNQWEMFLDQSPKCGDRLALLGSYGTPSLSKQSQSPSGPVSMKLPQRCRCDQKF